MPAHFEDGEDVVGVVVRFEVEEQRRKTEDTESGRGEDRAFQAVRGAFAQYDARRPRGRREVIRHLVEEALDTDGSFQGAKGS